jgi:shikimate kinase
MHQQADWAEAAMKKMQAGQAGENVYLIGPMGSGKTTLGRRVAKELGLEFLDCDQEIERRTGASVNLIFDIEGEAGFRARETEALRLLTQRSGLLVATGGGAVTRRVNRELMRQSGFVVWLRTPVSHQINRLSKDRSRPLLQTPDRDQRLQQLAAERDPLYREIAHITFDSSQRNIRHVAQCLSAEILTHWKPASRSEAYESN